MSHPELNSIHILFIYFFISFMYNMHRCVSVYRCVHATACMCRSGTTWNTGPCLLPCLKQGLFLLAALGPPNSHSRLSIMSHATAPRFYMVFRELNALSQFWVASAFIRWAFISLTQLLTLWNCLSSDSFSSIHKQITLTAKARKTLYSYKALLITFSERLSFCLSPM